MTTPTTPSMTFPALLLAHARGECDTLDRLLHRVARTYRIDANDVLSVLHDLYRRAGDDLDTESGWLARAQAWLGHPAARAEYYKLRSRRPDERRAREEQTTIAEQTWLSQTVFTEATSGGSRAHEPGSLRTASDLRGRLFRRVAEEAGLTVREEVAAVIVWGATGTTRSTAEFLGVDEQAASRLINRGVERLLTNVSEPVAAVLQRLMGFEISELAELYDVSLPAMRMRLSRGKHELTSLIARAHAA